MSNGLTVARNLPALHISKAIGIFMLMFGLTACGSSDDDEDSVGYIKLYNASPNSPEIFLTLDENLDEDFDEEVEQTYSSVAYGEALRSSEVPTRDYNVELAWQDEDSSLRTDLEIIFETQVYVPSETTIMYVLTESFPNPVISEYSIPVIDDDDDTADDLFNLRFLNLHPSFDNIDIYMSKSDETFNEAVLMGTQSYLTLSDNNKLDEDQYIVYITLAGSTDVLFSSVEISYPFSNQNILAIRENFGADTTPFVIDNITSSSNIEYQASDAQANFRLYNGIQVSDLIPRYEGTIEVSSAMPLYPEESFLQLTEDLALGTFTEGFVVENGDYEFNVKTSDSDTFLLQNQLVSLPANTQRTLFYYTSESSVDEDGDGDIDENGDGIIDETEAIIQTLVVDNSSLNRLYDHEVEIVNLVDSDDFSGITFYFVKSDESIESADTRRTVGLASSQNVVLRNNTYEVYAIANIDDRDIILDSQLLSVNEESNEQFLIFEKDVFSPTGYSMKFVDQSE
jgi:hypothetical protein